MVIVTIGEVVWSPSSRIYRGDCAKRTGRCLLGSLNDPLVLARLWLARFPVTFGTLVARKRDGKWCDGPAETGAASASTSLLAQSFGDVARARTLRPRGLYYRLMAASLAHSWYGEEKPGRERKKPVPQDSASVRRE